MRTRQDVGKRRLGIPVARAIFASFPLAISLLVLPIEPEAVERKLYVRLFGEVVREFAEPLPGGIPFVRVTRDGDVLVLQADPSAEP